MLSFDAPSLPSPLALRECTRPHFDGDLESLKAWLAGLKDAGVRQAGPALLVALESLRKEQIAAKQRLSVLAVLKTPVLKTCAGLPKPYFGDGGEPHRGVSVTLEQRINRLMFSNLLHALRQFDQEFPLPSGRQLRRRQWIIRNLFRFANRQVRYAGLWRIPVPSGGWRDLHELYLYLMTRKTGSAWEEGARSPAIGDFDPAYEYKMLLLLGFAIQKKAAVVRGEYFLDGLEGWTVQTRLEDPHNLLGRIQLILVEVSEDAPARQLEGTLDAPFRGWVMQPPYPYLHEIQDPFGGGTFAMQPQGLTLAS